MSQSLSDALAVLVWVVIFAVTAPVFFIAWPILLIVIKRNREARERAAASAVQ